MNKRSDNQWAILNDDYGDNQIMCILLEREIYEAYCYDINMIRTNQIKPNILEDCIEIYEANKICGNCKYKPF